jgi:hypothetical protein
MKHDLGVPADTFARWSPPAGHTFIPFAVFLKMSLFQRLARR